MTTTSASAKPKVASAKLVYNELRSMILNFELYPGRRVTETELAAYFRVSRTPIREAVQRLEAEGYLTVRPKQGCFIRELDIQRIRQYYGVRIALEMRALDQAALYMTDAQLTQLAAEWDPDTQPGREDDPERMEERDESFHLRLVCGEANRVLAEYLRDVNNHIRVIRRLDFSDGQRIDETYREHHQLCQLLLERDAGAAKQLMVRHIERSENFAKTLTLTQLAQSRIRSRLAQDPGH
ncbi:GntR family transcriptional regulator [Salinisphaera sp. T31B1]|uniref:GntR family transcriptional regulator n=1 Tax=Salinisphaera sp. T31B1 TaxID=727963 RepID=UPI003340995A